MHVLYLIFGGLGPTGSTIEKMEKYKKRLSRGVNPTHYVTCRKSHYAKIATGVVDVLIPHRFVK